MAYTNPLQSFRSFVKATAEPQPYSPGWTEGKGVLNLVFGTGELVGFALTKITSPCFQCSRREAVRHYSMGTATLKQGWAELNLHGKVTTAAGGCLTFGRRISAQIQRIFPNPD